MSKKNNKQQNNGIANLNQLEGVLGVKMQKVTKSNKTLSEKAQVMRKVNEAMHNLLVTEFSQYYKHIETDVVVTSKEGEHKLQSVSGYYLLFDKQIELNNEKHKGFAICKPTTYVKGGNSYSCLYYKEIGKTTIKE